MALNNTFTRQVVAQPAAQNPNQPNLHQYDADAALTQNLVNFGNQVLNVYAKADYEAAKRDMTDDYTNRSLEQKNALREANAIAEPRDREAYYNAAMKKINEKYGKDIDSRFIGEYQRQTDLDDKESLLNLRFKQTQDLQHENRLRAQRYRDNAAAQSAGADPAYAAAIDARVKSDLGAMLKDGSISRYEYEIALEDYQKKKIKANINHFLDSSPEDWTDEQISDTLNLITANVTNEAERKELKDFAVARIKTLKQQRENAETFNQLHDEYDLLTRSATENMSLAEIDRRTPAGASKEYKKLIKSLNGYIKDGAKLSDTQKAVIQQDVYDAIAAVTSNKNAMPQDYAAVQNKIYKAMEQKAFSVVEGNKILGSVMMPLNDAWGRQVDKLSADEKGWFTGDVGAKGVIDYLSDNGMIAKAPKGATKTEKARIEASNARNKVKAYQLYYSNLQMVVNDPNTPYSSIADIAAEQNTTIKRDILRQAQNATTRQMAQDKFSFLSGLPENQQPNKVLDGGTLTGNTDNIGNSHLGAPVVDTRYKGTAYDAATGKYGLVRADGTIEEVTHDVYKQYGGLK
ncbi:MAG: hypothetical protein IJ545_04690 [Alphaproteobacteria bacterium]|nr:hypothetical protein [Alphaproteobacteria bacterium]